jgi:hypothetical protein
MLKHYSKICPEGLRKTTNLSVVITTIRVEIWKRELLHFVYLYLKTVSSVNGNFIIFPLFQAGSKLWFPCKHNTHLSLN